MAQSDFGPSLLEYSAFDLDNEKSIENAVRNENVVFVTGHMPDAPSRQEARFPDTMDNLVEARTALRAQLDQMYDDGAIQRIITGGTPGADLMAIEWAVEKGVPVTIFLPFSRFDFETLVVDNGRANQYWTSVFNRAQHAGLLQVIEPFDGKLSKDNVEQLAKIEDTPYQHYSDVNYALLRTLSKAKHGTVVALWDGKGGDTPGGTQHAIMSAVNFGADYVVINNGLQNVNESYPIQMTSKQ